MLLSQSPLGWCLKLLCIFPHGCLSEDGCFCTCHWRPTLSLEQPRRSQILQSWRENVGTRTSECLLLKILILISSLAAHFFTFFTTSCHRSAEKEDYSIPTAQWSIQYFDLFSRLARHPHLGKFSLELNLQSHFPLCLPSLLHGQ